MSSIQSVGEKNLETAIGYYNHMQAREFEAMAAHLHDDVHFIGPLAEIRGKDRVVAAAKNLMQLLERIDVRGKFSNGDQIMLVYDFIFPTMDLNLRASVLMDIEDHLITRLELFYDAAPFMQKRDEIFD